MFIGIQYNDPSVSDGIIDVFNFGIMISGFDSKYKFQAIAQEMLTGANKI
jgi:hypothetical protein